jgi:protein-L-isoaspartate(D-aspartate) O-methyltransferase
MSRPGLPIWMLALMLLTLAPEGCADIERAAQRQDMLREIEATVTLTAGQTGIDRLDPRVAAVLGRVPRHEFVPASERRHAYENRPLPIGHGQTISQPYIVALMTDLLRLAPGQVVLEVGTGSGYQAAVLAEMGARVYTIEIIEPLALEATQRLRRLGYTQVQVRTGDGYYGWQEHAPFDAIIVTAAAGHVPPPLVQQLRNGGRMVVPVGGRFSTQYLLLVQKSEAGEVTTRQILPVAFVPLTGGR